MGLPARHADRASAIAAAPLVRHFGAEVSGDAGEVFELFTNRLGEWLPLADIYTPLGSNAASWTVEPTAGGEIFELDHSGFRHILGRVVFWAPPTRLTIAWFPRCSEIDAESVDVWFKRERNWTTRIDLVQLTRISNDAGRALNYEPNWGLALSRLSDLSVVRRVIALSTT